MIAKPGVPLVANDAYLDTLFSTRQRPKLTKIRPGFAGPDSVPRDEKTMLSSLTGPKIRGDTDIFLPLTHT